MVASLDAKASRLGINRQAFLNDMTSSVTQILQRRSTRSLGR
jgi:hypothetical protein